MSYAGHKKRNTIIGAVIATSLVTVAGAFWATSSNQGKVTEVTARNAPAAVTNQTYDSKYLQFSYKGIYHPQRQAASGDDVENVMLSADTNYDKHLAVVVSILPQGKIENNSSYNLRKNSPEAYTSRSVAVDGGTAIIYTKADAEQTAFIQHGDKVAVLAFSTTSNNLDNLQPEVDALLASFRWKG